MKPESFLGCHQMGTRPKNFCAAINKLMEEHQELKPVMGKIQEQSERISQSAECMDTHQLEQLRNEVEIFMESLEKHSYKEEAFLFEALASYIGKESGPIAVMEYEHHTAKACLNRFLFEIEDDEEAIHTLVDGISLLGDHFNKEENILFPMAEQLLTKEEKEGLAGKIL